MKRSLLFAGLFALIALPAVGQAPRPKKVFVLVSRGFEVLRMEVHGNDRVVYYRRGNMGRGKGQGPPMTLIIRQMRDKVVFVDTPDEVLVGINARLKL